MSVPNVATRSRREEMVKKRESKRPSRAGIQAGTSSPPTPVEDPQGSAFRERLIEAIARARGRPRSRRRSPPCSRSTGISPAAMGCEPWILTI